MSVEVFLAHAGATAALGAILGQAAHPGDVVELSGTLGAGKTCLTQGLARGLGVPPDHPVNSPTFTLIQIHEGRCPLVHMDFYRVADADELYGIGVEEYIGGSGVCVVEWGTQAPEVLPAERLIVVLEEEGEGRRARLMGAGARAQALMAAVEAGRSAIQEAAPPDEELTGEIA